MQCDLYVSYNWGNTIILLPVRNIAFSLWAFLGFRCHFISLLPPFLIPNSWSYWANSLPSLSLNTPISWRFLYFCSLSGFLTTVFCTFLPLPATCLSSIGSLCSCSLMIFTQAFLLPACFFSPHLPSSLCLANPYSSIRARLQDPFPESPCPFWLSILLLINLSLSAHYFFPTLNHTHYTELQSFVYKHTVL